ncbi:glutamate-1-semialdehyde 2,1-aminomutase [Cesiribacter andamanensis]|uniref:Glutamate-1-semialdehyde 2,1-aminomutase n=1 Tax=Cesiribacter andamanensis AMV16 TaxID=1279009 RepID=M7NW76_9BACT|nr:glutamate-1-semialdehyde 2,1-aminomutase [Cesiribacter andamanensis]EMR02704.1 Glutamate-1-semialdehyde 2,1-aminomutase [Cesiribacter andamanensis AMV16]
MLNQNRSNQLFERAQNFIPGGVNSPVRAFRAVGGKPLFMQKAKGAYLYDEDGNRYIDMINSWGPMILGHAHEGVQQAIARALPDSLSFGAPTAREVEMAELIISMVPSIEKVRMVNSGTEATMSAIRLARGFTGRDKIIKLEGCYHGHGDSFLIAAGSGALTMGTPDSPGVTRGTALDTLIAPYNNLQAIEQLVSENKGAIAALILEPVAGNMGCIAPQPGYLQGLRSLCDREGIVLIFDEVMTGFRLAKGGAQERFGVQADLTTLGKIIGGGMPVGAYGGRRDIMDFVSPSGPVYQAGTLSGNPIAMAAGMAMLSYLNEQTDFYQQLDAIANRIVSDLKEVLQQLGLRYTINQVGSMYSLFFTEQNVIDYDTAKTSDTERFGRYFRHMLEQGVYLAPSQYETLFVSAALGEQELQQLKTASYESLKALNRA